MLRMSKKKLSKGVVKSSSTASSLVKPVNKSLKKHALKKKLAEKAAKHIQNVEIPTPGPPEIKSKKNKKILKIHKKRNSEISPRKPEVSEIADIIPSKTLKRKLVEPEPEQELQEMEDEVDDEKVDERATAVSEHSNDDDEAEDEEEDEFDDDDVPSDSDLMKADEDIDEHIDFDFEAFPMEAEDRIGIVNMLTQLFFQSKVDILGIADTIIEQSPFGSVIGPAEDNADEDNTNVVYGVLSVVPYDPTQKDVPKRVLRMVEMLTNRADKHALKDVREIFANALKKKFGLLVNERMLNFPDAIVAPSFKSLKSDLAGLEEPYETVVYIHKLRVAEPEAIDKKAGLKFKDKKGLGKAAKKRLAVDLRAKADVIFDNKEDAELMNIADGVAHYFDYPVHQEVEQSSKFHSLMKDGKKYMPFRRAVVMDSTRFNAFVKKVSNISFD